MSIVDAKFNMYFSFITNSGENLVYITSGSFYSRNRQDFTSLQLELSEFLKTDCFKLFLSNNKTKIVNTLKFNLIRDEKKFLSILDMSNKELLERKNSILLFDGDLLRELTHIAINELLIENIII